MADDNMAPEAGAVEVVEEEEEGVIAAQWATSRFVISTGRVPQMCFPLVAAAPRMHLLYIVLPHDVAAAVPFR